MTATFTGSILLTIQNTLTNALALGNVTFSPGKTYKASYSNGVGPGQADTCWNDIRTLAPSANEVLALTGSLHDANGSIINFTSIKAIVIAASSTNTNEVIVGGAAANGFITPFNGVVTATVAIPPGGVMALFNYTVGYSVTATTGDQLKIANSGSGTPVSYDIWLIGTE